MSARKRVAKALERLIITPARTYLARTPSGQTVLNSIYEQLATVDLVPPSSTDDIARLHALFDVALDHGLGAIITDYVCEVCADRTLTSSDPVEAFLLDGECVRRWCQKTLTVTRGRLTSWLSRGIGFIAASGSVPKELARLQALQLVIEALTRPEGGRPDGAEAAEQGQQAPELTEALLLLQCGKVAWWLATRQGPTDQPTGRFASEQEWRAIVAKRRDACQPRQAFLATLLAAAAEQGVESLSYPPPCVERLAEALFLSGGTAPAALRAKLAVLGYYLLDGGFAVPGQLAHMLRAGFGVPSAEACGWMMLCLLDNACLPGEIGASALAQAASIVPSVDGRAVPFTALESLVVRGAPHAALALLRQRSGPGAELAAQAEAAVVVQVLLANGLLAEAFIQIKAHLRGVAAAERMQRTAELLRILLNWARHWRQLGAVVRLPFSPPEEWVVLKILGAQAAEPRKPAPAAGGEPEPVSGLLLVLYYLTRSRVTEALYAFAQYRPKGTGGELEGEWEETAALLRDAAVLLPGPQRALVVRAERGAPSMLRLLEAQEVEHGAGATGIALASAVPGLSADGALALLSQGSTAPEAPLVGSIASLVYWREAAAAAAAAAAGTKPAAEGAAVVTQPTEAAALTATAQQRAQRPLLFGAAAADDAAHVRGATAGIPSGFGAQPAAMPPPPRAVADAAGATPLLNQRDFDRMVLGVQASPASGGRGKRRRPVAGASFFRQ